MLKRADRKRVHFAFRDGLDRALSEQRRACFISSNSGDHPFVTLQKAHRINPLVAETPEEEAVIQAGHANKKRRQEAAMMVP